MERNQPNRWLSQTRKNRGGIVFARESPRKYNNSNEESHANRLVSVAVGCETKGY